MIHFYAYLSRMKHIKRWGLMRNTETENIKEHSLSLIHILPSPKKKRSAEAEPAMRFRPLR